MTLQNGHTTEEVIDKELHVHDSNIQNSKSALSLEEKDENRTSDASFDIRFRSEKKIFVGALTSETTEQNLTDYFSQFGEIYSCAVKISRETGVSRGFGFVVFKSEDSVKKVLATPEHLLNGKKIDPKPAKCNKDTQRKVFVGGLDPEISTKEIEDHFNKFGKVEAVETPFDNVKMRRKSYAFVVFAFEHEAKKAASVERQEICGKSCDVRVAVPRETTYRNRGSIPQQVLPADFQQVFLNLLYYGGGWNQPAVLAALQNQLAANSWHQQQVQQAHQRQQHSRSIFDNQQSQQDKYNTAALVNRFNSSLSLNGTAESAAGSWVSQHEKQQQHNQPNNGYANLSTGSSSSSYFGFQGNPQQQAAQQQQTYPYVYSTGPQAGGPQACYLTAPQYADGQQTAGANGGTNVANGQQTVTAQPANYHEFINAAAMMAANQVPFITAYPGHPTAAGDMVGFQYRQQSMHPYYQSPSPTDAYNTQAADPAMVPHRPLLYGNGINGVGPKQHYAEQQRLIPARLVTGNCGKPVYSNGYQPRSQNGNSFRPQNGSSIPPRENPESSLLPVNPDGDTNEAISVKPACEDEEERQSVPSAPTTPTLPSVVATVNGAEDLVKVGDH